MNTAALRATPQFDTSALVTVHALTPLSLVCQLPGKYYRTVSRPQPYTILAMLENAMGWHLTVSDRDAVLRDLQRIHKPLAAPVRSGVNFSSILQYHVKAEDCLQVDGPEMRFDDYWLQHLRTAGGEAVTGSRDYDSSIIPLMGSIRSGQTTVSEKKELGPTDVREKEFRAWLPRYYPSPTPREYVLPYYQFVYRIRSSEVIVAELENAVRMPAAPLYLGTSDGWIDVQWRAENGGEA